MSEQDSPYATIPALRGPDVSWASGIALVADEERTKKKWSTVTLVHTGTQANRHVIVDRHLQPVDLQPGQRKESVQMLDEDIENLRRHRGPGRFYPSTRDPISGQPIPGQPKPDHPILIENVVPYEMPAAQRAENEKRADAARRQ